MRVSSRQVGKNNIRGSHSSVAEDSNCLGWDPVLDSTAF